MAKLREAINPTFPGTVSIHQPGNKRGDMAVVFKYRKKSELEKWWQSVVEGSKPEAEVFLEMVESWDRPVELNRENVDEFLDIYHTAGSDTLKAYFEGVTGNKLVN